jgi:CDP-diacylglycerol--glycerol-3-phosphate 3-phosphatidyltransferase
MALVSMLPNALSMLRLCMAPCVLFVPREFLFLYFCLAGLTDALDGFFARKFNAFSPWGVYIDPTADKAFALFCGYLFFSEHSISGIQLVSLFSRDISLIVFAVYLFVIGKWGERVDRSFLCGKISTILQSIVFSFLALGIEVLSAWYVLLCVFAVASFIELRLRILQVAKAT